MKQEVGNQAELFSEEKRERTLRMRGTYNLGALLRNYTNICTTNRFSNNQTDKKQVSNSNIDQLIEYCVTPLGMNNRGGKTLFATSIVNNGQRLVRYGHSFVH